MMGRNYRVGKTFPVPALMLSVEHYNLLARLLESGVQPKTTFNGEAKVHDEDVNAHYTLAEIPGIGDKPEVVMLGAHLDSWHGPETVKRRCAFNIDPHAHWVYKLLGIFVIFNWLPIFFSANGSGCRRRTMSVTVGEEHRPRIGHA